MICLSVYKNDELACVAGFADATILTAQLSADAASGGAALLHVGGLCDLPGGRSAHLCWIEEASLALGDRLRFEFTRSGSPTAPRSLEPSASPKHLAEQAIFRAQARDRATSATPPPVQRHALCSLLWDIWMPETCKVYVRASGAGGEGSGDEAAPWLHEKLEEGQSFDVQVAW
jgi:hypothetical protein